LEPWNDKEYGAKRKKNKTVGRQSGQGGGLGRNLDQGGTTPKPKSTVQHGLKQGNGDNPKTGKSNNKNGLMGIEKNLDLGKMVARKKKTGADRDVWLALKQNALYIKKTLRGAELPRGLNQAKGLNGDQNERKKTWESPHLP